MNQSAAADTLPCGYCGRSMEAEALKAVPQPGRRGKLACPTCAARMSREFEELRGVLPKPRADYLP